jgi:predicted polyphosphate/ATP-dependent NAD kinase
MKKLGLIVNPVAGLGGRVGLRGSDGENSTRALQLGAVPISPQRTVEALHELLPEKDEVILVAYPDEMGTNEATSAGFQPETVGSLSPGRTTANDTRRAARELMNSKVDLLLFAGGDGTARDICESVDETLPVLGIPAGVKMHSGVFAVTPAKAGQLARSYLRDETALRSMEVVDFATQLPNGDRELKLFGYLKVPYERSAIQGMKTAGSTEDGEEEIAYEIIDSFIDGSNEFLIIGPGKTAKAVLVALGLEHSMLGVDVLHNKAILLKDANEKQLLGLTSRGKSRIIVGVIGGQGFLFGRGNQQISPEVIKQVGTDRITIVATRSKIIALEGRPILVDTGDKDLDKELTRYFRIVTGYRKSIIYKVAGGG